MTSLHGAMQMAFYDNNYQKMPSGLVKKRWRGRPVDILDLKKHEGEAEAAELSYMDMDGFKEAYRKVSVKASMCVIH